MKRRIAVLLAAIVMGVLPATTPAVAADPVIVSGPGSYLTTYTQPLAVAQVGGRLTYVNADAAPHDVVAVADGPSTQPWCADFTTGCPIFWSPVITLGKQTQVLGLENLEVGKTYQFYCSLHRNMVGFLVAAPAA